MHNGNPRPSSMSRTDCLHSHDKVGPSLPVGKRPSLEPHATSASGTFCTDMLTAAWNSCALHANSRMAQLVSHVGTGSYPNSILPSAASACTFLVLLLPHFCISTSLVHHNLSHLSPASDPYVSTVMSAPAPMTQLPTLPPPCDYTPQGSEAAFAVGPHAASIIGAYRTGNTASKRSCVLLPDEFGWRVPQTRQLCDELASRLQALVLCPDVHRGNHIDAVTADTVCSFSQEMALNQLLCRPGQFAGCITLTAR